MAAPSTPITSHANQTPAELKANAEQRRVIVSPAVAPRTQPTLQHAAATSVANHGHEIFIQCLYMLPVVGNAMSLWDVGTDIHGICSGRNGGAKNPFNWGILTIDAIGVVPAAGNASRPARAVVKEVLLAFAKGSAAAVLVDIFWATAGGNVVAFMSELDKHLQSWKDEAMTSQAAE